ncbi:MAG: hypothetical protein LW875_03020 [Proteobacteria bacterium]|jgi:hypothetical protein|nr:hypothetical protein [Pseudomonadota bacterium]
MSNINSKENQMVKTGGIMGLFSILTLCCWLLAPVFSTQSHLEIEKTQIKAQSLGYQLLQIHRASKSSRAPASAAEVSSEGSLGTDLWGQPFRYSISSDGSVLVYSLGKNKRVETIVDQAFVMNKQMSFGGDDVGVWIQAK